MQKINLRIGELRRRRAVSQQALAKALGVAFQTVSKWENKTTMPDIAMLPEIASYFEVSVDQLMGLKPLSDEEYIPVQSGTKDFWNERLDYLIRTRKSMWNRDYMAFLVEKVWRLDKPVSLLDCGCGGGFFAAFLLPLLPEGSSYTGVDMSEKLIAEGRRLCGAQGARFICADFMEYSPDRQYDVVISQAVLRHIGNPVLFLERMISACCPGGLVICVDVNRELESDGLYIEGMDYGYLCSRPGFEQMWKTELEKQDRDFAVGIRLPCMMARAGLKEVGCRLNDKVDFLSEQRPDYEEALCDFVETKGWAGNSGDNEHAVIEAFMNHGMTRLEAEEYCRKQRRIEAFLNGAKQAPSIVAAGGLMISYGRK